MGMPRLTPDPSRFYDGGIDSIDGRPAVPPDPTAPPQVELRRLNDTVDRFAMLRRIAYRDREYGELLVPAATQHFTTDLASVPWLFTWLVPKVSGWLPAAILHDGLVYAAGTPPTYVSTEGYDVLRPEANRVLRDAMADTRTGLVRRWLVWSAVTAATMLSGSGTGWTRAEVLWRRWTVIVSAVIVVVLGTLATLDLFDVGGIALPWMGRRGFGVELAGGLAGAVVIPLVLGLAWGRFRVAGWILGVALAVLLHVTVVIALLTALYQSLEWLARTSIRVFAVLGVVVVVASVVEFVIAVVS